MAEGTNAVTNWIEIVAGAFVVLVVFSDVFETVILPRPSLRRFGLVRRILRLTWYDWRWAGMRFKERSRTESLLATFGPSAVLMMFVIWGLLLILGYALIFDGLRTEMRPLPTNFGNPGQPRPRDLMWQEILDQRRELEEEREKVAASIAAETARLLLREAPPDLPLHVRNTQILRKVDSFEGTIRRDLSR